MKAQVYGFNPPFIGGPQNVLSRQEDAQLIKNDILQLLLTIPGERVMRPEFGVNLRNAVFEPGDRVTLTNLEQEIIDAIGRYEPRIILLDVAVTVDISTNQMNVQIRSLMANDPAQRIDIDQFIGINAGP